MGMKARTQYRAGAMIKGERIAAKARTIDKRTRPVKRKGKTLKRIFAKFTGTAYCVIESQPAETYNIGDSLRGEIISGNADKSTPIKVSAKKGTERHKIQTMRLAGDAICVIERPLKCVSEALASKRKK